MTPKNFWFCLDVLIFWLPLVAALVVFHMFYFLYFTSADHLLPRAEVIFRLEFVLYSYDNDMLCVIFTKKINMQKHETILGIKRMQEIVVNLKKLDNFFVLICI